MSIWEELDNIYTDEQLNKIFFDSSVYSEEEELNEGLLTEMANMLGSRVKIDPLPFSFYFSRKNASRHGIRLKIFWDANRINEDKCGYVELHGDYRYSQDPKQKFKPDSHDIATVRYFAKKYKPLFAAVWEGVLGESELQDYFRGDITFKQLLSSFYPDKIGKQKYEAIQYCNTISDLDTRVRQYNIYNLND